MPRPCSKNTECRNIRLKLGMSQKAFAEYLNVSQVTIKRVENDLIAPSPVLGVKMRVLAQPMKRQAIINDELERYRKTIEQALDAAFGPF